MNGRNQTRLYWFNWPSRVGGADTKFVHLLPLLSAEYDITVVPNQETALEQREWRDYLERHGVRTMLFRELPDTVEGWAVSLCNKGFFSDEIAVKMKAKGAGIVWSNEMMWHFEGELDAVRTGLIDRILYVSPVQRAALEPGYLAAAGIPQPDSGGPSAVRGEIQRRQAAPLPWVMTGNWISPDEFPFRQRGTGEPRELVIGRLSRPDPDKFPDHFPRFYEGLAPEAPLRFRVMGWSEKLQERWSEHQFDSRWELLPPAAEPVRSFLDSLDVLVYNVSPRFRESWGRAVVEAMLSGVVPLVPRGGGHHLENLVDDGVSGFLCDHDADFSARLRQLRGDRSLLARLSAGARQDACRRQCHAPDHLSLWRSAFA